MESTKQITTPLMPLTRAIYHWNDIKLAMCEVLEINESDFRDYHNVVGGDYKDCWHVIVSDIFFDDIGDGSIIEAYPVDLNDPYDEFNGIDKWKVNVIHAWNQVITYISTRDNTTCVNFSID